LQGGIIAEKQFSDEQIKAHILYKLSRHYRWGGKHTELINVRSALPPECRSQADSLAKELADAGFITWLKKTGQIHISLNTAKKREIVEIVRKYLGEEIR
jgi:hypothetical protein